MWKCIAENARKINSCKVLYNLSIEERSREKLYKENLIKIHCLSYSMKIAWKKDCYPNKVCVCGVRVLELVYLYTNADLSSKNANLIWT